MRINPSVLFCPRDRVSKDKFESTSYAYSMAFYHSPDQIDNITSTRYTYDIPGEPSVAEPSVPQRSLKCGQALPKDPYRRMAQ